MPLLADMLPEQTPHVERLESVDVYLYFSRIWFMEGSTGEDGRTGVIIFTQSQTQGCRRFGCVNYWRGDNKSQPVHRRILFDEQIPCKEVDRMTRKLIQGGILGISSQKETLGLGHFHDTIGFHVVGKENWYDVGGGVHLDKRHNEYILPVFFAGKYGPGSCFH